MPEKRTPTSIPGLFLVESDWSWRIGRLALAPLKMTTVDGRRGGYPVNFIADAWGNWRRLWWRFYWLHERF